MRRSCSAVEALAGASSVEGALNDARRQELEQRYDRLLREHGAALRRVAASYERDAAKRDDLVQEIALALWRALPDFRGDCSERTFVFRIAHNRSLTHVWRRKAGSEQPLDQLEVVDPSEGPEAQAVSRQRRERLLLAIRGLALIHRQVLTLQLEELTQAEIGSVLGVSENAVAVRLSRARQALREALGVSR